MKISTKENTTQHKNNAFCEVIAHHLEDKNIDCAISKISGRYPTAGRVTNMACSELAYVFEGNGKVVIEGKEVNLNAGDAILIEAGEKYFWDGNMQIFISCRPAWYPEQHQPVE